MSSKKGLGKGLGALMGSMDLPEEEKGGVLEIPVNLIDPLKTQPRQNFDQEKLLAWHFAAAHSKGKEWALFHYRRGAQIPRCPQGRPENRARNFKRCG